MSKNPLKFFDFFFNLKSVLISDRNCVNLEFFVNFFKFSTFHQCRMYYVQKLEISLWKKISKYDLFIFIFLIIFYYWQYVISNNIRRKFYIYLNF